MKIFENDDILSCILKHLKFKDNLSLYKVNSILHNNKLIKTNLKHFYVNNVIFIQIRYKLYYRKNVFLKTVSDINNNGGSFIEMLNFFEYSIKNIDKYYLGINGKIGSLIVDIKTLYEEIFDNPNVTFIGSSFNLEIHEDIMIQFDLLISNYLV